jgi:hypothetical protein
LDFYERDKGLALLLHAVKGLFRISFDGEPDVPGRQLSYETFYDGVRFDESPLTQKIPTLDIGTTT